jgi:signal transduction histidine kinase
MSSVKLADTWSTTTFRLTLVYGAMFTVGVVIMLSLIYWKTAHYFAKQTDHILLVESAAYSSAPLNQLSSLISIDVQRDVRNINIYGLFSSTGKPIAGKLRQFPINLPIDGKPHELETKLVNTSAIHTQHVRLLAKELPDGSILVIGRDEFQIAEIRHIMLMALLGAASVILIVTLLGFAQSVKPVRRIRQIQQISDLIMHGDIHRRLPIAGKHDELDMLAQITNRMLDTIERLMMDVKGASDSIAHDLRTPLTRLRALLHRAQTQMQDDPINQMIVAQSLAETDALLVRFRALMRIAEISSLTRRAGFDVVDLGPILLQAEELYAPLADEKNVAFSLNLPDQILPIVADGGLLFEAIANLLDNAIKFTPTGGTVCLQLVNGEQGARIEVIDNGVGIIPGDIKVVTQPFYRGEQAHQLPGIGLGLSIVTAIARLHDFRLSLSSDLQGTQAIIECWGETFTLTPPRN